MSGSAADRATKQQRMTQLLINADADAVLLTSHEAVSWYLEGARTHVSLAGPPVIAVRAARDGDEIFVAANEAERLAEEELLAPDAESLVRVSWDQAVAPPLVGALPESAVAGELRRARASLLTAELARYRALCAETACVMTDVLSAASPGDRENALAAAASSELRARGIDPLVVLVAGAARLDYRHPLPTAALLGDCAMLVVCGRRHGMIANATRWVQAGAAAGALDEARSRILEVEATFFAETRPGVRLSDAFRAGIAGYGAAGFDGEEWRQHHQGGPTGYAGRDPRATFVTTDSVQQNQAFAWNPSAPGVKVEDTVLVTADGIEPLTVDPRWPTVEVRGILRPVARDFS
ncbi:Xaa-Pro aminopeptidase [Microbacterium halimionae]|uniref:Xaa-Pro aminopeptidase n=1 Tax=Microbacterium halimionae TaxID=1526413 RepID=A0A7W3JQW0_9MICO|nr:M24 family metallopeptidase [Microbacterium halimionae]MBA8817233.1 Xaa-Pro aminopeptidase [Microbacterium halimionae]NII94683.1 Xaa-Pro aminopeptidase [Microbacterium halimionae]